MNKLKIFFLTASSLVLFSASALAGKLEDGINLFNNGDYEKATAVFEQFSQEDPNNAEVHLWLSKCYEKNFQVEKQIQETKIYSDLKYKRTEPQKTEPAAVKTENKQAQPDNVIKDDPLKLIYLNDDYLDKVIGKRNPADEIKNLKFIDYKSVKSLLAQVPSDSETLVKMNREYEIKSHYGLASPQDLIILNKTRANLIAFDIDTKKFELSQATSEDRKKSLEYDLKQMVKAHNEAVETVANLINQPVFQNNDPVSFEFFQATEAQPDDFIKNLEKKKSDFRMAIERSTKDIKNYTKSIISQEKNLKSQKEKIEPKLLEADLSTLNGPEKELVVSYTGLEDKVAEDKKKLLNFIAEQNILIEAFNKINNTIMKIKPDYVITDAPLPKQEKLQELK